MKWLVAWSVLISATAGGLSVANAQSAASAIKEAQRTGRPIFAVAGASYCPHCVTLMKRLNTEERLQPLIAEFVPLKLDVSSRDFKTWEQFFPRQRSAIPALYIVTPKGEQLYGKLGSLPTEKLEKVMIDSLTKAGKFPSEQEWKELDELARQADELLNQGEVVTAVELMHPHFKLLFYCGDIMEYHEAGQRILKLFERVDGIVQKYCRDLEASASRRSLFEQALEIARAKRVFTVWPPLVKEISRAELRFGRTAMARRELRLARDYDRAVVLLSAEDPKEVSKAVRLLKRIVERYPETHEVAVRAAAELEQLNKPDDADDQQSQTSATE